MLDNKQVKYGIDYIKAVMSMLSRDSIRPNNYDRWENDKEAINEIDGYLKLIDLYDEYEIGLLEMRMLAGIKFDTSFLHRSDINSMRVKSTALDLLLLASMEHEIMFNFLMSKDLDFSLSRETFKNSVKNGYYTYVKGFINRGINLNSSDKEDSSLADYVIANILTSLYIERKENWISLLYILDESSSIDRDKLKTTKAIVKVACESWIDGSLIKSEDILEQVKEVYKLIQNSQS